MKISPSSSSSAPSSAVDGGSPSSPHGNHHHHDRSSRENPFWCYLVVLSVLFGLALVMAVRGRGSFGTSQRLEPKPRMVVENDNSNQSVNQNSTSAIAPEIERIRQNWLGNLPTGQPLRMLFVHVGKAGGGGVRYSITFKPCDLLARKKCWANAKKQGNDPNSTQFMSLEDAWVRGGCAGKCKSDDNFPFPLSRYLFGSCHVRCTPKDIADASTFLITTRHPLSRLVSAFNYWRGMRYQGNEQPNPWAQRTFGDCFKNIDQAAQVLLLEGLTPPQDLPNLDTDPNEISCVHVVQNLYLGLTPDLPSFRHFVHGYPFYKYMVNQRPEIPIVVIRHEYQLDDLHKLDRALGGKGDFPAVFVRPSSKYEVTTGLETKQGQQVFCCLIWTDIQAHQDIILRATNLNDTEKKEALAGAFDECSVSYDSHVFQQTALQAPYFSWSAWHSAVCSKYYKKENNTLGSLDGW